MHNVCMQQDVLSGRFSVYLIERKKPGSVYLGRVGVGRSLTQGEDLPIGLDASEANTSGLRTHW